MTRQKPRKDALTLKDHFWNWKKKEKGTCCQSETTPTKFTVSLENNHKKQKSRKWVDCRKPTVHHPSSLEPRAVCASYRSVRAETADCHRTETGRDEGADWRTDWRTHRGQSADTGKRLEHRQRVTWNIKPNMEALCRHIPRRRKLQIIFQRLLLMLSRLQNETSS